MSQRLSYIEFGYESFEAWNVLCGINRYRIAEAGALPPGLPPTLLQKSPAALILSSEDTILSAYVMANLHRVDKENIVDHEPLIMAFDHQNRKAVGAFLHHGSWAGRSYAVNTAGLVGLTETSGIQRCFPLLDLPNSPEGPLDELKVVAPADLRAFWNSVTILDRDLRTGKGF